MHETFWVMCTCDENLTFFVTGSLPDSWAVMFHMLLNTLTYFYCVEGGDSLMQQKCTESQRYWLSGRRLTPVSFLVWQLLPPSPTWGYVSCVIYDFWDIHTQSECWKLQKTRLSRKAIQNIPLDIICADLCIFVLYNNLPCIRVQCLLARYVRCWILMECSCLCSK